MSTIKKALVSVFFKSRSVVHDRVRTQFLFMHPIQLNSIEKHVTDQQICRYHFSFIKAVITYFFCDIFITVDF